MTKLGTILDQIDSGTVLLPEFQRGYVWNRDQVRGLMSSLYRGFPVGSLLLWETGTDSTSVRGGLHSGGTRLMLLDGQQRVTSLYGIIRGCPPAFFEGNENAFTGLCFDVENQSFEFYAPTKMEGNPHWIQLTDLFQGGLAPYVTRFVDQPDKFATYVDRLNRIVQIKEREFLDEKITGVDKTIDVVVDIFNRVNSGGTHLSKGDLALAKICAELPIARTAMRHLLAKWDQAGYQFSLDWLLRHVTAVATGRSVFSSLDSTTAAEFEASLDKAAAYVGTFLDAASSRLGLDHHRVLMGRGGVPVVSRMLHLWGGKFPDAVRRDKVLYWYVHSALWGRYAGSTETQLQRDYEVAERAGVDGLIAELERWRGGNLDITGPDFDVSTMGSRFYPLLYLLTRVKGARDLGSGLELKAEMLGKLSSLQVHHIFPKALLYKTGRGRNQVNSIANFCFLTQDTNLVIGKRPPEVYFAEAEAKHPGVLASQWIPTDPALWKLDRYEDFLSARQCLLATAAQSFLTELREGTSSADATALKPIHVVVNDHDDARVSQVRSLVEQLLRAGFAEPELDTSIADPHTGKELAVAEAYWPAGLQVGQGTPVILELDPEAADLARLEELGIKVFTSAEALLGFAARRNQVAAGEMDTSEAEFDGGMSAPETNSAALEFESEMKGIYERARREANYNATYFLSMVAEHGGLATARKLLHAPAVSDGFAALWERGRLDLSVEAIILQPRFAELFDDVDISTAQRRLNQFGYAPSAR